MEVGDIMRKTFSGFCPAQNKDYSITVEYIDVTSLNDTQRRRYEKGMAECRYNMFGDKCDSNKCPIIAQAPETL